MVGMIGASVVMSHPALEGILSIFFQPVHLINDYSHVNLCIDLVDILTSRTTASGKAELDVI